MKNHKLLDTHNVRECRLVSPTGRDSICKGYVRDRIMCVSFPNEVLDSSQWRLVSLAVTTEGVGSRDTYFRVVRIAPHYCSKSHPYNNPRALTATRRFILAADKTDQEFSVLSEPITWSEGEFIGIHIEQLGHRFPSMSVVATIERYDPVTGKSYELLQAEAEAEKGDNYLAVVKAVKLISQKWSWREPWLFGDERAKEIEADIVSAMVEVIDTVISAADDKSDHDGSKDADNGSQSNSYEKFEAALEAARDELALEIVEEIKEKLSEYLPNEYCIKIEKR